MTEPETPVAREKAQLDSSAPLVPLPRAGLSGLAIVLICAGLAIALFVMLESSRRARTQASAQSVTLDGTISSPAPLQLPMAPPEPMAPAKAVIAIVRPAPAPAPAPMTSTRGSMPVQTGPAFAPGRLSPPLYPWDQPAPAPAPMPRLASTSPNDDPVLLIDNGAGPSPSATAAKPGEDADGLAGDDNAVRATRIRNRVTMVPQGTVINAVLETPIDSTRTGLVRAMVSRDVRGFDGTRILIPRGSRLIGEAQGDVKPGQKRVLVNWTRLIRPDGIAIRISSPASDTLGGAGIAGHVNSHFFARFANAALQSALTAGMAVAARNSGNNPFIYALPGSFSGAGQSLFPDIPAGATIKVSAGAEIAVFVSHDLDFGGAAGSR